MLIDQSLCGGLGPVFFELLLCKHFQNTLFGSSFPIIVTQKAAGEKGVRLRNDDGPFNAGRRSFSHEKNGPGSERLPGSPL